MQELFAIAKMFAGGGSGDGESPLSSMQEGIANTVELLTSIRDQLVKLNTLLSENIVTVEPMPEQTTDKVN